MLAKENGLIDVLQATDPAAVLQMKSIVQEHCPSPGDRRIQNTETNRVGYDKEVQGPRNPLSSSRKQLSLQVNAQSPGHERGANAN